MAGTYYGSTCDDNIVDPECTLCVDDYELSGIGSAAVIHKTYYPTLIANPTSYAVWLAGIQAGHIKIIPNIRGEFDGGSPKYGQGYGRRVNTYLGAEYKGKLYDANYIENALFYDSIAPTSNWHVAITSETQVHISKNPVTFSPTNPITDDIQKAIEWVTEFTFQQQGLVIPYTYPAGIFDCAYAV